jgi:hypothetical protein
MPNLKNHYAECQTMRSLAPKRNGYVHQKIYTRMYKPQMESHPRYLSTIDFINRKYFLKGTLYSNENE